MSGWIPVTERLPKVGELVLVWSDYDNQHHTAKLIDKSNLDELEWENNDQFSLNDITAWQELPNPYKG